MERLTIVFADDAGDKSKVSTASFTSDDPEVTDSLGLLLNANKDAVLVELQSEDSGS